MLLAKEEHQKRNHRHMFLVQISTKRKHFEI